MKKLLTFFIVLCFLGNLYAQDEKIIIGVKGGLNIASVSNTGGAASVSFGGNSSSYKNQPKLGLHLGGYAEIKISEVFSVQPELLYSMKGYGSTSKVISGSNSSQSDYDLNLSYIDIPVQMRFNVGKGFHILAGPYIGIMLAANTKSKSKVVNGSSVVETESKDSSKDGLNTTDVGMYLGLGYQLESGLNFGLRWTRAFTDLTDYGGGSIYDLNQSNNVFQFSVGYNLLKF